MCDLEKMNPDWTKSEEGMEEYMELNKKIYENVDNEKFKNFLIKGTTIPKQNKEES